MKNKMIITDLDGTLLNQDKKISDDDLKTLENAKTQNIYRVMATGRHLYSITKTFGENPPFDYAVFSCGNGLYSYNEKKVIDAQEFQTTETKAIIKMFFKYKIDFMVHDTIPENHFFTYKCFRKMTPAFKHRIEFYQDYTKPFSNQTTSFIKASQFLVICLAQEFNRLWELFQQEFPSQTIVYSSSPFQDSTYWIEILPGRSSKSRASQRLCYRLGIKKENLLALGNDYNDMDLLQWAKHSYIVENAPDYLREKFHVVASNNHSQLTEAFNHWISLER